jgi:WD40 repeat protein
LWDVSTADPNASPTILRGHKRAVSAVAYSPDGGMLATGDEDAGVRLWPLAQPAMHDLACRAAGRNLSADEWQQYFGQEPYRQTCASLPPHPSVIARKIDAATALARAGKIAEAMAGYTEAQRLDPQFVIDAAQWNTLCRLGVLSGHVKDVLEACGRAVALAPDDANIRDSRGLARALTGDSTGAIEDFEAYIAWIKEQDPESNRAAIAQRQQWIADLKAGRQPFDKATLEKLKVES